MSKYTDPDILDIGVEDDRVVIFATLNLFESTHISLSKDEIVKIAEQMGIKIVNSS